LPICLNLKIIPLVTLLQQWVLVCSLGISIPTLKVHFSIKTLDIDNIFVKLPKLPDPQIEDEKSDIISYCLPVDLTYFLFSNTSD